MKNYKRALEQLTINFDRLNAVLKLKEDNINALNKYIVQLEHDIRFYQESARTTQYCMNNMHVVIANQQAELEALKSKDKLELAQ